MFSLFSKRAWDDPDWKVRQRAAQTKKDPVQLRRLALTDVSEEVRLAAVQNLDDEEALVEVVKTGGSPASRQLAVSRIADPGRRTALVLDRTLPEELRMLALKGLGADERLLTAYRPDASEPFKLALLEALKGLVNDAFWANVPRGDPVRAVREKAIGCIKAEKVCVNLSRSETDPELRRLLSDAVNTPELLYQLLELETKETQRIWLASRIREPAILDRIVRNDRSLDVRLAALIRIEQPPMVRDIACANLPKPVAMAALARLHDDESRGLVAMRSPIEEVRAEALRPILDEDVLSRLEEEATSPEIRWLAGRRVGSMPIKALAEIRHGPTLRRLIEQEAEPEVATWLVSKVGDQETLRVLGGSTFPGVAAAQRRLNERTGPLGLRFMIVPGRPYEMSVFPVTVGQLREALGPAAVAGKGGDDLPAAGITPEVAAQFCEFLSAKGGGTYRLPSFEEWRHACMTDDENWLDAATGQFSWAEALLGTQRLAFGGKSRRPALMAWPNPWGFLDMVGNVAVWVHDPPRHWMHLVSGDPLAVGGNPSDDSAFALAAGVSWADTQVKKENLHRLVARSILTGWGADKVGFRVLCEQEKAMPSTTRYKLVLLPQTAPGITKDIVIVAMGNRWSEATSRLATWYRVAPAVVLLTPHYTEARRIKRLLESCGARTQLTTEQASGTTPPMTGTKPPR